MIPVDSIYYRKIKSPPQPEHRVVVTGIGLLSPVGLTLNESWRSVLSGQSGIAEITRFPTEGFDVRIAGEVKNFNPDEFIHKKEQKKMDLFIHYSLACAQMAMKDSGFIVNEQNRERVGVMVGSGIGGLPEIEDSHTTLMQRGPSRISPFFIPKVITNMASGHISIMYGAKGPNLSIVTACATGVHSLGEAYRQIRYGYADAIIAGGTEATVSPLAVGGFASMKALSTRNNQPKEASRPFDRDRDGFVLGEGAAVFVLEDYESASRRGAKIYGEIAGYAATSDAYHMTNPAPEGEGGARAMKLALTDAEISPSEIEYINAHGTSTPVGDQLESLAIENVFSDHAKKLWVSSTKSMTGHLLGGAGAIESAFCLMALKEGAVPPTINLENPGENCNLDYVPWTSREKNLKYVMNNSFGFGGTNACMIFKKV